MAEICAPVSRRVTHWMGLLLACGALDGCGEGPTPPVLTQPGFVMNVSIPGLTDTTIQGDSLYWRFVSGLDSVGELERKDLTLELLVLDPPPPLLSPLVFQLRWSRLEPDLPAERSYGLDSDPREDVLFQAISNLGVWFSYLGQVRLDAVSDSSISGVLSATLVQIFPYEKYLPNVKVNATFRAPHTTDF